MKRFMIRSLLSVVALVAYILLIVGTFINDRAEDLACLCLHVDKDFTWPGARSSVGTTIESAKDVTVRVEVECPLKQAPDRLRELITRKTHSLLSEVESVVDVWGEGEAKVD